MTHSPATRPSVPVQHDADLSDEAYVVPASFAQQRLWLLDQFAPGTANYNIPRLLRLSGRLDRSALTRTLNEIVRRHEVLRTTFAERAGRPLQIIADEMHAEMPVVDLGHLPESQREAEALRLAEQEIRRGFDLKQGPLWRANLWCLDSDQHLVLLNLHHVISDGWSMGVLNHELTALYGAFVQGLPSPLPELPIQYADFSEWQREWLSGDVLERQLNYWREQLRDVPVLDLPLDRPRPPVQSFEGASRSVSIPEALSRDLQTLGQRHQVTLFMTLLASFQVLLHRYSQQDDIAVGSPIAGRNRTELEGLIGFFVNTLVMRTDLSGSPTFSELLKRVRTVCLGAYEHQDLPFEKLVEELRPERDLSRNPLFQVAFVLQNTPGFAFELPDCEITVLPSPTQTAKFDLTLSLHQDADGIGGSLSFNTDLFDSASIDRLLENYLVLLGAIVDDPEISISELPLLTEGERRQPFIELNATQVAYPRESGIAELFDAQVEKRPDAVALVFDQQQVSYRELNDRSNRLGRYLRTLGVERGSLVGIAMPRSVDMVVGILGILKAGGAYVPLDLAYPRERIAYMLQDTGAALLLTHSELRDRVPDFQGRLLCVDDEQSSIEQQSETNLECGSASTDLAYVMYTSGSTGQPKGVQIPQRGVVRLVRGANYVDLDAEQVHLLLAPIAFDASTFELWGALLNGARCVCFPDEAPTIQALGEVIRREGVTTLWLTASLFNMIVDEAPETLAGTKQLLTGGEALSIAHVRRAQAALPDTQLINGYGPTESTTFACCHPIPNPLPDHLRSIPIGRPISNTRVYVLDASLSPVPVGVPGELYIGGDGLAQGYLGQAELTAERFRPDPFSEEAEARIYKTGDRARVLGDGTLEFLGRIDHQVKIRGFRIEPGEIEAVLTDHAGVRQATVIVQGPEAGGDKHLVAFVVPAEPDLDEAALRTHLSGTLPAYMLPTAIVMMDALPITANGKIDRKALPAPVPADTPNGEPTAVPETETERRLVEIWADLLKLDTLGIHDNFFSLGGHSLLATQLVSRIAVAFSVNLSLPTVFESPTVQELARHLDADAGVAGTDTIPAVRRELRRLPDEPIRAQAPPEVLAPARSTESILTDIWRECLGNKQIDRDANFFEIGGHSLLAVKLIYEVEQRLGKRLPLAHVFEHPTLREMTAFIEHKDTATSSRTLVPIKATGFRTPFFCIHGRAEALGRYMDDEQPFYWLHHGQDAQRTPYMSVEDIAALHLADIRECQPKGPYCLGGFSFGGLLALEMARQLRAQGEEVALLALFDPSAPLLEMELKDRAEQTRAAMSSASGLGAKVSLMASKALAVARRRIRSLQQRFGNQLKRLSVARRLRSGRELPPELAVFRLVQHFRQAARAYQYKPYPGRIVLFVPEGRQGPDKQRQRLERQWRDIAAGGLEIHRVEGAVGHHRIVEEPYVQNLVAQLDDCLRQAQAPSMQDVYDAPDPRLRTAG